MAKQAQINAVKPALDAVDKAATKVEKALDVVDKVADTGTDVIEAGLEKVADVIPDALDTGVHVSTESGRKLANFLRNPKNAAISVVILAAAAGVGLGVAGYSLAVKRLKAKMQKEFDIELESEIAEIRRMYAIRSKDGALSTPAGAVEALIPEEIKKTLVDYSGISRGTGGEPQLVDPDAEAQTVQALADEDSVAVLRSKGFTEEQIAGVLGADVVDIAALREKMQSGVPIEVTETSTSNVFVDGRAIEDFDYATEVAQRSPDEPYVITHDEFMQNENGWENQSLTYYNGDDVLVDDQQMPIPDIEGVVDSANLSKFGHGSRDPNVVYVRNERLETDFEITARAGSFGEEVAGVNELRHSAPLRRFRAGDDG